MGRRPSWRRVGAVGGVSGCSASSCPLAGGLPPGAARERFHGSSAASGEHETARTRSTVHAPPRGALDAAAMRRSPAGASSLAPWKASSHKRATKTGARRFSRHRRGRTRSRLTKEFTHNRRRRSSAATSSICASAAWRRVSSVTALPRSTATALNKRDDGTTLGWDGAVGDARSAARSARVSQPLLPAAAREGKMG